ncbi:GFA family protein [Kordiimonas marina]|uniref:GFA family protein n=1 Tax=Kordiimonas marina TaxID=2872312 RepID=UPI001FF225F0|nr:hypothetical protein [Kordiimonas marina]MCJ9429589.1 hypothetical protein [Kordiimonas marina]
MTNHTGGCYCGNITIRFESGKTADALTPRACDCDFCTLHGAEWLSDPEGALTIEVQNEAALSLFKQGSESAHFWICQNCGGVSAVTSEIGGKPKGAVNARALDDHATLPASVPASPKVLSKDEKLSRWDTVWTPVAAIRNEW